MTLDQQILEVMQQIGGIFQKKNIISIPICIDYLEETVTPGMETIVVMELILHLEDLFSEYLKEEKKVHKYTRYVESFKTKLDENSDGGSLIGRSKRTA